MASPLDKAIQAAYDYHPYGVGLSRSYGWTIGPTFMVKTDDGDNFLDLTTQSSTLAQMVRSLIAGSGEATTPVEIEKNGHPKEQKFRKDKYGALHPMSAAKCTARTIRMLPRRDPTGMEMPFPLLRLAKKVGDRFTVNPDAVAQLYVWNKGELTGIFQAKYCQPDCILTGEIERKAA